MIRQLNFKIPMHFKKTIIYQLIPLLSQQLLLVQHCYQIFGEYEGNVERDCNSGCYWQRDRPTSSILMLLFLSSLFGVSQLFLFFFCLLIHNNKNSFSELKVGGSKLRWEPSFMFVMHTESKYLFLYGKDKRKYKMNSYTYDSNIHN